MLQRLMQAPTCFTTTLRPWSVLSAQHEGDFTLLPCTTLPSYLASFHLPLRLLPLAHPDRTCFTIFTLVPPTNSLTTCVIQVLNPIFMQQATVLALYNHIQKSQGTNNSFTFIMDTLTSIQHTISEDKHHQQYNTCNAGPSSNPIIICMFKTS